MEFPARDLSQLAPCPSYIAPVSPTALNENLLRYHSPCIREWDMLLSQEVGRGALG